MKKQPTSIHTILNDVIERVNNDTQRLRILEQNSESLTSRMNGVEQSSLQSRRDLQKALGDIDSKITALDDRLSKLDATMKEVVTHMKKLVTESRLKELENLVDIYNPMKSDFVTREELDKMMRKPEPKAKPVKPINSKESK